MIEVPQPQDVQVLEALGLDALDQPFGKCVEVGGAAGQAHDGDAGGLERPVELLPVPGIVVAENEPWSGRAAGGASAEARSPCRPSRPGRGLVSPPRHGRGGSWDARTPAQGCNDFHVQVQRAGGQVHQPREIELAGERGRGRRHPFTSVRFLAGRRCVRGERLGTGTISPVARREALHIPVLLDEVLELLAPRPGQTVVDCTVGLGGHGAAILERLKPGGRLIGIDLDPANSAEARIKLQRISGRENRVAFDLFHASFAALPEVLAQARVEGGRVDAVLADLGVASTQIDDPARGFSYRRPGPLDMRMDRSKGEPASALVNRLSERDLAEAILEYGDEADARAIARLIVQRRAEAPITMTEQLMALVCEARDFTALRGSRAKLHPAARTFQALRILVNREMESLDRLLTVLPDVLKPGGVAAIITFHSGEDRRVKHAFRDCQRAGIYASDGRDPIVANESEQQRNPRSRSAKLRWARTPEEIAGSSAPATR